MKKLLKIFSTLLVVAFFTFTFSACNSATILHFNNNFCGGENISVGYNEKITYSVKFTPDSDYNNTTFTCDFFGTYTIELTVLPTFFDDQVDLPQTNIDTTDKNVYKITSTLSLNSKYNLDGKEKEYSDLSVNTVYTLDTSSSLAPIYSFGTYKVGNPFKEETNYNEYSYNILYNTDMYKVSVNGNNEKENEYEYTSKSLIDNASLLFALRNTSISEESSLSLPVVAVNYGESKTLSVRNEKIDTKEYTFTLNGAEITEKINVKNYSFNISSTYESGLSHKLKIQNTKSENLPLRSILLSYSQPVSMAQNPNVNLGYLEFTISEMEFSK